MKNLFSLFIFVFLALIALSFYSIDDAGRNEPDSPSYKIAKQKFWESYLSYKDNVSRGIKTEIPTDPSGNFRIDEQGNFNMVAYENDKTRVINPKFTPDIVNNYIFTQSNTTYTSINTTGTQVSGSVNCDDSGFGPFNIGFNFTYNGAVYTQFGVCCNGSMQFGAVTPYLGYTPLQYYTTVVVPGANDMQLYTDGAIYYQLTGSAPNRVLTIEWYHQGFYYTSGNELSYEIKLYETTNAIQFVYQTGTRTSTRELEVGINGSAVSDFSNRTTTSNWAATTPGATNAATCTFSPTIYPASGLTFTWAPPAPPATPTLVRPLNHAIGRPLYDTLQWTASSGATNYHLQIALDSLMTQLVFSDTTMTGVQYTVGQFSPLTNWWWRVRAKNSVGWSAFTVQWVFRTMGAATTPTLLLPANNAINQPLSLSCVWTRATDQTIKPGGIHVVTEGQISNKNVTEPHPFAVSNYWYELYSDTTAAPVVRDSTLTDTTRAVSGLLNNTNYWWRVKAKNNVGWGAFSAYFRFTTIAAAPPVPVLLRPTNGSFVFSFPVWLVWRDSSVITSYRVQVSPDTAYSNVVFDTTLTTNLTLDSVGVPLSRLVGWGRFYWHVRATNAGGTSAYSSSFNFMMPQVGVNQIGSEIPKEFKLFGNYPNPFNPECTIKFDLPGALSVKLVIYNALGQEIDVPVDSRLAAGSYLLKWNGANFPSGIYFYKITAGNFSDVRKMVLVK